jgi:AraC-like DNA-binding protein
MLHTYKPESSILQKYIEFFYVFSDETPQNFSYIVFPHVFTAISFFKGVDIDRKNYTMNINTSTDDKYVIDILGKYTQPVFLNYKGKCNEITIIFKPLGINHFFQNDIIELTPLFSQELKNSHWTEFTHVLFNENSNSKKIQILETFLLSNLKKLEINRMYDAIKFLEDFDKNYTIDEVASLCNYSLKSFQRHFKKYVACTPCEYKRIARFRYALQSKIISNEIKTLTSVSSQSNYNDQSYFIREFKKLTHQNPKRFFNKINVLTENKIIWQFL